MRREMGPRKLATGTAALLVAAAAAFLGVYSSGLLPASATSPHGNISVDVSPGDNSASSVGPILQTISVGSTFTVDLVIGKPDGSGGIPAGNTDIAGWQVRLNFDSTVLVFGGLSAATCDVESPPTAEFYMEKADPCTTFNDNHITVTNVVGPGIIDIGSTITGTPPGANGVGLLATLLFTPLASGGTCISIGDTGNSFYADITGVNHNYAERNGASLGVNGGTAPDVSTCVAASGDGDGGSGAGDGDSGAGDGDSGAGDGDSEAGDGDSEAGDGDSGAGDGAAGDGDGGGAIDGDGAAGDGSGGVTEVEFLATLAPGLNIAVTDPTVVTDGSTAVLVSFADEDGNPLANVDITCKIEEQPGTDANLEGKTEVTVTADAEGLAKTTLNTGTEAGSIVVACSADDQTKRVTVNVAEAGSATGVGSRGVTGDADGGSGDGWLIPVIVAASGVGGLALIAGAAAYWRRYRRRA